MCSVSKRVEKLLTEAGFARAGGSGPGFCAERERHGVLVGYVGQDGEAVGAEEAQRHLSAYAGVLLAEGLRVDRVSGAYHCLRVSAATAADAQPARSDAA